VRRESTSAPIVVMALAGDAGAGKEAEMAVVWYVEMRALEGEEERVRDGLARLVAPTRAVPGCLVFEVHQEANDPAAFSIYEQWQDYESHEVHRRSDHFRDIAQAVVIDHSQSMEAIELELLE
jgi:quinol monooxygenase YgiN